MKSCNSTVLSQLKVLISFAKDARIVCDNREQQMNPQLWVKAIHQLCVQMRFYTMHDDHDLRILYI